MTTLTMDSIHTNCTAQTTITTPLGRILLARTAKGLAGAWFEGQKLHWSRPSDFDPAFQRHALRSYGFGVRVNLFNFALLRWDYAIPLDDPHGDSYWRFSLGPSF